LERRDLKRGISLLEVMLAATLFLLLLGVVLRILFPLFGYFRWTSARAELVQAAALTARYLVGDLQRAPMEGVVLPRQNSPELLSIHGVDDVTDTGRAVWSADLIVYSSNLSQGTLTRILAPGNVAQPLKLPPEDLKAFLLDSNLPRRTLVRGLLHEFELKLSGTRSLPLRLRMVMALEVPGRPPQTYEHVQNIQLRNGGS
jgi:hypothetical protein